MSRLDYEQYEDRFNPMKNDRKARRKRKIKLNHIPRKTERAIVDEIADVVGLEGGFNTTYRPSRYEEGWLLSSLQGFFDQALITDVLAVVKGGKEASVYRCEAHPRLELETGLIAAKVYRPRMFRNLSNDAMYREGREILTAEGRAVKKTDHRLLRAVGKKTAFGEEVAHTSWLMYEYTTLQRLYKAGAAVPTPFAVNENAILMTYYGDEQMPAPTLNEVHLDADEVEPLFHEVLRNIELMLQHSMIHGDLSAYNILYWDGQITLIDFPQVTNSDTNSNATFILRRDVERVCEYFIRQGVDCDPLAIARKLAERYVRFEPAQLDDDV